ncbi:MarR family winged helix-turn-helix transcriptional regulator [Lichenifustis flavocetrariae]|uniref:MarR family transcriptional regulator n=1 Tax=Lichenifustis flavocetrariae TaxID=2949735 RepID=A0AA41Z3B7_9HYPH|nr:MarR family transcriptional regulator [Lichenifustis flavocetrariae]MCW6509580.1 MarR family transcriptional regulator [Lichenifustis flavocetrariae]
MSDPVATRPFIMASMVQASRKWRKLAQVALAVHGISQARASALVWVHRLGGGVRQVVLASYIGIEGTSLVRLLDELSSAGLVLRKDDPSDRRAKTIWLTQEGERLAEEVETVLRDLRERVLDGIDIGDVDATLRVCGAIERSAALACSGSLSILDGNVLVTEGTIGSADPKIDD